VSMQVEQSPVVCLRCTDNGHVFWLRIERTADVTLSQISDSLDMDEGYALFRDRTLIECPYCRSLCRLTGVTGKVEVKFTPAEATT
jgi:hypothetical protein